MYRVWIRFDAETEQYCAGSPELDLYALAPSREEALEALDAEVANQFGNMENIPEPMDSEKVDTRLELQLSATFVRELNFFARTEGVEPSLLAQELLSEALSRRLNSGRGGYSQGRRRDQPRGQRPDGRGVSRERYHDIMENKASFLEYVRGLENGRPPKK